MEMNDQICQYCEASLDACLCDEEGCTYCGGEGVGVEGADWDCDDPLWIPPGTIRKCPNCGGSGKAKDMTFW